MVLAPKHRKVDFKTNALNNAHVSQLLHYKAGFLPNDGIALYFKIKTNSLQVDTTHRTLQYLLKCPKRLHFQELQYKRDPTTDVPSPFNLGTDFFVFLYSVRARQGTISF
jgi:hypothetical protein